MYEKGVYGVMHTTAAASGDQNTIRALTLAALPPQSMKHIRLNPGMDL
jgi:hypothetical protein